MLTTTDVVALIAGMIRSTETAGVKDDEFYSVLAHNLYDAAEREVTRRRQARHREIVNQVMNGDRPA